MEGEDLMQYHEDVKMALALQEATVAPRISNYQIHPAMAERLRKFQGVDYFAKYGVDVPQFLKVGTPRKGHTPVHD